MSNIALRAFWAGVMSCALAGGQNPSGKLAFEAVSIKPAAPTTERRRHVEIDASQVNLENVALSDVVRTAYGVVWDEVVAPDWLNNQRFDIQAKLPAGASVNQVPEMLQTLLAERFNLAIHRDQKIAAIYALKVAKDGPKFHESAPGDPSAPGCMGGLHKVCHKTTMADLVNIVTLPYHAGMGAGYAIDRDLQDQTGLKGAYDFNFDYGRATPADGPDSDLDVYTAFSAVKSLGLTLEPTSRAYDIVIVDHIERAPTAN